ncbi:C1 family peptidase [Phormidium sp. CLA17]|uniref:C1 family peptidase n=1 Tax=Leptolyngbya sp. Cla-17 TaxID=2803751 RepID=UPI001492A40D|nr:C1 family peptidase [Leptolyngbya sp. Cla-17]MBM0743065.1 C1 family peptidase [Leptolyngbya sp. Cla-17]
MSNNSEQKNIDWKKKGLGWIPDYPDLKDYRLASKDIYAEEGRLKKADSIEDIETLADTLGKLVGLLVEAVEEKGHRSSQSPKSQALKAANETLKRFNKDIFGDVAFLSVSSYIKFSKGAKFTTPFANERDFIYESDFDKRIFELKSCLYFLFQTVIRQKHLYNDEQEELSKKYGGSDSESTKLIESVKVASLENKLLQRPGDTLSWLRSKAFDKFEDNKDGEKRQNSKDFTVDLVILFQFCAEIAVDGVVGLETYTTLDKYLRVFSEKNNFEKDKHSQEVKRFIGRYIYALRIDSENQSQKSKPSQELQEKKITEEGGKQVAFLVEYPQDYQPNSIIRLVPVPPPMSNEVFDVILAKIKSWVGEQLNEKDSDIKDSDIFEKAYLEGLGAKENSSIFEEIFKGFGEPNQKLVNKLVEEFFQPKASELGGEMQEEEINIAPFIRVFQDEFSVIEPIFSCVLKLLYPLAGFRNQKLKDVIGNGLDKFKAIVKRKNPNSREEMLPGALDRETAINAVWAVDQWITSEVIPKIREAKDKTRSVEEIFDKKRTLCFYFFMRKLVKLFYPEIDSKYKDAPNIFDKQEAFEICRPISASLGIGDQPKPDKHDNDQDFFRVPKLQMPLSSSLIDRYISPDKRSSEPKKPPKLFLFLPGVVDLSLWCSAIEDQGALNSCTAFAGIALLEYFMNRSSGKYTDVSPLFLYKATRDLMNLTGDVGASVREMMKAMALFGVPPEQHWSYDETKVDDEPPQFCYSYAQNYQALKYFRLDYAGISKEVLLFQIKAVIAAGFPCVFGLTMYTSAYEATNIEQGIIPFPHHERDRVVGGHAVVAIGYDNYKVIQRLDRQEPSTGAILIRNSFGADWGQDGYGWLPYDYVLAGLTADWWSLLKSEWFNESFWQGGGSGETIWGPK